jgi:hypothetical protein
LESLARLQSLGSFGTQQNDGIQNSGLYRSEIKIRDITVTKFKVATSGVQNTTETDFKLGSNEPQNYRLSNGYGNFSQKRAGMATAKTSFNRKQEFFNSYGSKPVIVFGKLKPDPKKPSGFQDHEELLAEPLNLQSPVRSPTLKKYASVGSVQLYKTAHPQKKISIQNSAPLNTNMGFSVELQTTGSKNDDVLEAHFNQKFGNPMHLTESTAQLESEAGIISTNNEIELFGPTQKPVKAKKKLTFKTPTTPNGQSEQPGTKSSKHYDTEHKSKPHIKLEDERVPFDDADTAHAIEVHHEDKDRKSTLSIMSDARPVPLGLVGFPKGPYRLKDYFCQKYNIPEYKFSAFMNIMKSVRDKANTNFPQEAITGVNLSDKSGKLESGLQKSVHFMPSPSHHPKGESEKGLTKAKHTSTGILGHQHFGMGESHDSPRQFMKARDISTSNLYLNHQRGSDGQAHVALKPNKRKDMRSSHKRVYELQRAIVASKQGKVEFSRN